MPDRKIAPRIFNATDFKLRLKPYEQFSLTNGLPVYTLHAGKEEVLSLDFVFLAGNSYEDKDMVAASTNFLLKNGTTTRSAYEVSEFFDYHGAFLSRKCYNETATISVHCLTRHLASLLPVFAELLTDASFPEEELQVYKNNANQRLDVNLKKSDFVANRMIDAYVFGPEHPYGKYTTHEALNALTREDIVQYYDKHYKHGNALLFVSGHLPNDLQTLLEKYLSHLPLITHPYSESKFSYSLQPDIERKRTIIHDTNAVQGSIRIARHFPNRHSEDYTKAQVMNTLFGGYFGSRLMSNIREDKGYTYGIHSYIQNHISDTALVITSEANKDVCAATVEEIWKEARKMQQQPVMAEELHLVKNYLMGGILGELDGPFEIMNRWKNYILNNLDDSYFYQSIETIKNITVEEIQEAAMKYLNEEDFWQLTVY